jgi:hypothetical protein
MVVVSRFAEAVLKAEAKGTVAAVAEAMVTLKVVVAAVKTAAAIAAAAAA